MHHKSRNQALDILRGLAILLVLGCHFNYFELWGRIGWTGVDLFFVLSGFLISGLLFSEQKRSGSIDIKRFLIRRGFKIYPSFYLLMALTTFSCFFMGERVLRKLVASLLFLQNYVPWIWQHTWSLAVEEHFYLMLPLLLLLMAKKSGNKKDPFQAIPWVFAGLAATCLSLRVIETASGVPSPAIYIQTHLRIDSLFAGVTLGYYRHYRPDFFKRLTEKPIWIPGILLLVPTFFFPLYSPVMDTIGFTSLYLGYGCIVAWAADLPSSTGLAARAIAWTGRHSYSIYLWHLPIRILLFSGKLNFIWFLIGMSTSIAGGVGMSLLIEFPYIKMRDRLFPARNVPQTMKDNPRTTATAVAHSFPQTQILDA